MCGIPFTFPVDNFSVRASSCDSVHPHKPLGMTREGNLVTVHCDAIQFTGGELSPDGSLVTYTDTDQHLRYSLSCHQPSGGARRIIFAQVEKEGPAGNDGGTGVWVSEEEEGDPTG